MTLRSRSVTNISTILTVIICLIIALSIPAGYFINAYLYMMGTVNTEMAFSARTIEGLIANNPTSWKFEEIRLQEILERRIIHDYEENRTIRDLHGGIITEIKNTLSAPRITFSQPVYDSGTEVARLEIECSLMPLLGRTAAIGTGSVLLGIMIFLAFYFFILRTVREAYEQLQENEKRLTLALKSGRFGILDWDLQKNIMLWDDRLFEIHGLSRASARISVAVWQNYIHEDDRQRFSDDVRPEVIAKRGYDTELRIVRPDGAIRYIKADGIVVTDERGKPSRLISLNQDVTERRQAEESLRESERMYRLVTEKMTDIVWIADMNLRTIYVSPSVSTVLGFTQEERTQQTIEQQLTPDSITRWLEALAGELEFEASGQADPGRQVVLVLEYYHKDGSTRWLETTMSGIRSDQGVLTGLHGVSRDITEQKRAEDALRASEELYTRLVNTIPDIIVRTDLEGKILFANDYTLRISGYSLQEIEGRNIFTFIVPEDQDQLMKNITLVMEGKEMGPTEYRMVMKDGTAIPFEVTGGVLRNENGTPFGLVSECRDVRERKQAVEMLRQSEEKFHKVFMSTPDCIAITRVRDGLIIDVNHGFESIVGWRGAEAIGRFVFEINFWTDLADREYMIQELKSGNDVLNREFQFRRKDGELRSGIYSARSITIADEACLIFSMRDITEKRQLEEERLKLEQQLFQSQKMEAIGQLAGGVAHDFNNMLSVIIGNTEMAMGRITSPELLRKALEDIMSAGKRSADLTRQLLAFARKQTINPEALDLNDVVTGMLKMLQRLIGENINLIWNPAGLLWSVKMDPSQVDQILVNLVVNARDAIGKEGRINIETANKNCDEACNPGMPDFIPGEYVLLAVSDNGCGMGKEILANIFEPFFTTKNVGQGTGLGLATVYGIVKQNNGFINVYSEPGQGTAFKIYLPRYQAERPDHADVEPEPEIRGGSETILIVEDEEAVLKLSSDMLQILGYCVLAARSTEEAIQLARQCGDQIDLLLTDVVMPNMNGKELADRITAIKPDLKRLYMSGYTADLISRQGILEEGVHFISKPFSLRGLAAKVRETLG